MHTGRIPTDNLSGRPTILPNKQILLFLWSVANKEPYRTITDRPPLLLFKCPRQFTLCKETKPDISCEWNTKFSVIPEIPSKRVRSKRIPKFSKNFPGFCTGPFSFGPEISEFLVECILGDPGATSRNDAIFSGERHFWRESSLQGLKSPWALFLTKRVPEVVEIVPLIGQKFFSLANQQGGLAG